MIAVECAKFDSHITNTPHAILTLRDGQSSNSIVVHVLRLGALLAGARAAIPRAKQPVKEREALREVAARLDVVALVVLRTKLYVERVREPRRRPKVSPLVHDARVAVKLLEEEVRLRDRELDALRSARGIRRRGRAGCA